MKKKNVIFGLCGLFLICFIMFSNCEPATGGNNPGGAVNGTPTAADYNIGNLTQTEGSVTAVIITAKSGKSSGARTVYYDGNTAIPQAQGKYAVTFDVAAATDWNAATGLYAGNLTVSLGNDTTPTAADYDIGNLTQTAGSVTAVTITPKSGKSSGARTVYYDGNTAIPQTQGEYTVTFDVAATTGWDAVTGLFAGILTVNNTGNNPGNTGRKVGFLELARMDIEDAHNLVITKNPETSKDDLYKTTDSGKVQEVTYTYKDEYDNVVIEDAAGNVTVEDKDGNDITDDIEGDVEIPRNNLTPSSVYNAGADYIIVCYGYNEGYLVRKSDGAVFSLKDAGIPSPYTNNSKFSNAPIIRQDSSGNIYYQNISPGSVVKLDVTNPDRIIKTICIVDPVYYWDVSGAGHIIYGVSNGAWIIPVVRKSNGGLFYLPTYNDEFPDGIHWWIGLDGNIRFALPGGSIKSYTIYFDLAYNYEIRENNFTCNTYWYFWNSAVCSLLRFPNMIVIVDPLAIDVRDDPPSGKGSGIIELENNQGIIRDIPLSTKLRNYTQISSSNKNIYLSGNNIEYKPTLIKVNPNDYTVTILLEPGTYSIYKMTVSPDDIVTFNALRMSDGAKVIGEISATGQVRILDTTLNTEVVVLERIR